MKKILLSFCFLLAPIHSFAKDSEISVFSGFRTGGEMDDATTGNKVELDETNSYGIIIGTDYGPEHVMEFLYSYQNTNMNDVTATPVTKLLNVDLEYFHAGGSQIWSGEKTDKFFGATLGAIHLNPNNSTLSSKTRFSMSLGGGMVFKFTQTVGLRLETRAYFSTFGNSSTFCNDNNQCVITGDGFMRQVDFNAGLRFRF